MPPILYRNARKEKGVRAGTQIVAWAKQKCTVAAGGQVMVIGDSKIVLFDFGNESQELQLRI